MILGFPFPLSLKKEREGETIGFPLVYSKGNPRERGNFYANYLFFEKMREKAKFGENAKTATTEYPSDWFD